MIKEIKPYLSWEQKQVFMDSIDEFVDISLNHLSFLPMFCFIQIERLPLRKIPNYACKRKLFVVQETIF